MTPSRLIHKAKTDHAPGQRPIVQAKLQVNAPGDRYEQEADAMAERVIHGSSRPTSVMRKADSGGGFAAPSGLVSQLGRGGGSPLSPGTRGVMENAFSADFSRVRVHTDGQAADMSRQIQAKAFTHGSDIYFNQGQYAPESTEGKRLLAHELTHTVQQDGGVSHIIQRTPLDSYPATALISQEQMDAGRRSRSLLSTSIVDWAVTDTEAREVLQILRSLHPESLLWVIMVMRLRGDWRTFVEELPEQDRPVLQELLYSVDVNAGYVLPGDAVRLEISINGQIERDFSLDYNVTRSGVSLIYLDQPVQIAGTLPQEAANRIARAYIDGQIFFEPSVRLMVTSRGASYSPATGSTSQSLWTESTIQVDRTSIEVRRRDRQRLFINYVTSASLDDRLTVYARLHYFHWIEEHFNQPDLYTVETHEDWSLSLGQASAPPPQSPLQPFIDLMRRMASRVQSTTGPERQTLNDALNRYIAWFDSHLNDPDISHHDPVEIWTGLYSQSFQLSVSIQRERYLQEREQQSRNSPERQQQREAKFQEFYELAMQLWGYRSRHFPYRIPIPSEGRDILVWDDSRQVIFNQVANQLMDWATHHMFDDNYTATAPTVILSTILRTGGFDRQLEVAASQPVVHESIDRHEIIASRALESFGRTIGTGLLVIGLLGAAVGLGVLTGGAALVIIGGLAAYAGISSYLQRREEIERTGYEVPIPMSMMASIGDIVGLSQLIEGLTGERIDSGRQLTSIERSDQIGEGGGSVALLLAGSRAFRGGRSLGHNLGERAGRPAQLTTPRQVPAGPEGAADFSARAAVPRPVIPPSSSRLGGLVDQTRNTLDQNIRVGFDTWIEEIITNGGDPQQVLARMRPDARARVVNRRATDFTDQLTEQLRQEFLRQRASDNPLNPLMARNERIGDVDVSWNRDVDVQTMFDREIIRREDVQFAQAIFNRTGEPVRLFGDTASNIDYPGIDGTIGNPARPLSLKRGGLDAHPNYARWVAEMAYQAARTHGYTHVEVHIRMLGRTRAEIRAAWDAAPPEAGQTAGRPYFDSSQTVSTIIIEASDGIITMNTPPLGPVPPVGVRVERPSEEE